MTGDLGPAAADRDVYARLIAELDASGCRYRLIEHAPEGRTEVVSALRGHVLASAAKCLILLVKIGKKQTRYVLAVVPGDARVDLAAVRALLGASYVAFFVLHPAPIWVRVPGILFYCTALWYGRELWQLADHLPRSGHCAVRRARGVVHCGLSPGRRQRSLAARRPNGSAPIRSSTACRRDEWDGGSPSGTA